MKWIVHVPGYPPHTIDACSAGSARYKAFRNLDAAGWRPSYGPARQGQRPRREAFYALPIKIEQAA